MGSVFLCTDRPGFEPLWRPICEQAGLHPSVVASSDLPEAVGSLDADGTGIALVIDASSPSFDEDELLATVGMARACNTLTAVSLVGSDVANGDASLDDLLEEMCPGLVARRTDDARRVAALLVRQADRHRAHRFEFVTVSPRGNELLVVLGNGRSLLLPRPVSEEDDGTEITTITLSTDARSAELELVGGSTLHLDALAVANRTANASEANGIPIEGARLGKRLRELRKAAGLTQAEVARRTGIHRPNIARVEAGRHTPSLETLARLATAIGVPTTRVLSED
ncbi:MAG: helix-turn-helix domain-containing protein [Myxococcota bacterium]